MTMNKIIIFFLLALGWQAESCKQDNYSHEPLEHDGTKPGTVSIIKVTNLPGSATIQYTLPKDPDLQYVVARYSINNGTTKKEVKSSYHENQLTVDGFGQVGEYPVALYAVDRSGNESSPVMTKVHPDTAAYMKTFSSLDLISTFGGANIAFNNDEKGNIGIVVITANNNGELVPVDALYTSQQDGSFTVRGYDTVPRVFGVYVTDRWNNVSDTLMETLTPLFEKQLDRTKFQVYPLPDDAPAAFQAAGFYPEEAWDGKIDGFCWHTATAGVSLPLQITMDLGLVAKLSRFTLWERKGYEFEAHSPREYAIWGRATPTNQAGYDGWIKLRDCESIKPSGLPVGQNNADDLAAAAAGEQFDIPADAPPVRYIRIEMYQNWSNGVAINVGELAFWGDY